MAIGSAVCMMQIVLLLLQSTGRVVSEHVFEIMRMNNVEQIMKNLLAKYK